MKGIENELYGYYRRNMPELVSGNTSLIASAVSVLRDIYRRNVHHSMKVAWSSYPDFVGHDGCFRCHSPNLVAEDDSQIRHDCTLCHSILAYESDSPFEFMMPSDSTDPLSPMHEYLRLEFLGAMIDQVGESIESRKD